MASKAKEAYVKWFRRQKKKYLQHPPDLFGPDGVFAAGWNIGYRAAKRDAARKGKR